MQNDAYQRGSMENSNWRGTEPNDKGQRAKFATRRDRALATVILSVDPSILYIIGNPEDPEAFLKFSNHWKWALDNYFKGSL